MGGKGGGGGNPAAEAAAREAARRARIAGNIKAVKARFYAPGTPRDVPEGITGMQANPAYAATIARYAPDEHNTGITAGSQAAEDYVRRAGHLEGISPTRQYNTNQAAIDPATAYNQNIPLTDQPTAERLAAFEDIENRIRNRFMPEFRDTTTDARRELKFALARRGIFGGSAQLDAEGRFRDRVAEGENEIGQRVVSGRNEKQRLDTNLLNNLISQAQADTERSALMSGIGATQLSNASRAQQAATDRALATNFADVGTLFKKINDQRALQQGIGNTSNLAALMGLNRNQSTADLIGRSTNAYYGTPS